MKKWLRRGAIAVALLVLLAAAAVFTGLQMADRKAQRRLDVPVRPVAYTSDVQALERGRYLYASRGCAECHGANGAGRTFAEDDGLLIHGANISPAGVVARYLPQDWVRSIRHGVAPDGRPLRVMPSEDFNRFTDEDLAALVAYVRALPPAPGGPAEIRLPLPARVMYGFGLIQDSADKIDHALPPQQPVAEGVNLPHGAYVANMCLGCHGHSLAGGRIPGAPPDWPPAPNLNPGPGSVLPRYATADALLALFRSGRRPDGTPVQVMPFETLKAMSETDVRALHLYLMSRKVQPAG